MMIIQIQVLLCLAKMALPLKLQKGSGYIVPWGNKYIPPHLHYRYEIKPSKFSRIETVFF